jgi:hypothetical protein
METTGVECLRTLGVDLAELVKLGCDLPVVDLALRIPILQRRAGPRSNVYWRRGG